MFGTGSKYMTQIFFDFRPLRVIPGTIVLQERTTEGSLPSARPTDVRRRLTTMIKRRGGGRSVAAYQ